MPRAPARIRKGGRGRANRQPSASLLFSASPAAVVVRANLLMGRATGSSLLSARFRRTSHSLTHTPVPAKQSTRCALPRQQSRRRRPPRRQAGRLSWVGSAGLFTRLCLCCQARLIGGGSQRRRSERRLFDEMRQPPALFCHR
ncbi:uncharacterized protein LOC123428334 [Hordeum vulgare subsp. vulgare]|uniref:uncharacterized protein LOC123428334 n=1 Tax=Hordeum vulgare subsp. vulgare TaxID=112509 RepID=UPI001D1A4E8E|nr:uncharacterized protein LOC123428334 [Hordeum vulgare subsp. vulgare]